MDIHELMDEIARLGEAGDATGLAALCAPEMRFTQNTGTDGGVEALVGLVTGLNDLGISVSYSDIRRTIHETGVVEQHLVTLTRADGVSVSTDICVVATVGDDGRLTRVDEYLDSAALTSLFT